MAMAMAMAGSDREFDSRRPMAAWQGLVPQDKCSSGGKTQLECIANTGDAYLCQTPTTWSEPLLPCVATTNLCEMARFGTLCHWLEACRPDGGSLVQKPRQGRSRPLVLHEFQAICGLQVKVLQRP